ncbi:hypothetical protein [Jiangella aurantiaca]|uniref:hypothetical protein n=1 Tax=Jiangella aurantiaca TaxID=2530373 RepID=UPI0013A5E909|nr:hypothetical protein [Jiangella aurantiaca]
MNHDNRRGTLLSRLRKLRQYTEVIGQILRDLWPLGVVISSILGAALHQFG